MDSSLWKTESVMKRNSIDRSVTVTKDIWILRHGQAVHNPRAEYARDVLQCSHQEFLSIMEQDDCFDAPLTSLGIQQAQQIYTNYGKSRWCWRTTPIQHQDGDQPKQQSESTGSTLSESKRHPIELVVSSPLSRALQTAELALGVKVDHLKVNNVAHYTTSVTTTTTTNRVCYEGFREINGWLQNGKRQSRMELERKFPWWDFSFLSSNDDAQWTPTLETTDSCMERGYHGLLWIMKDRPERSIVLASHGALLKYTLTDHPNVILRDGRDQATPTPLPPLTDTKNDMNTESNASMRVEPPQQQHRCVRKRFHNCEIRRYRMELLLPTQSGETDPSSDTINEDNVQQHRDTIVLTEVDL